MWLFSISFPACFPLGETSQGGPLMHSIMERAPIMSLKEEIEKTLLHFAQLSILYRLSMYIEIIRCGRFLSCISQLFREDWCR
jgi:hypothetical protein